MRDAGPRPVLGVDACPGGWVGAEVSASGVVSWRLYRDATFVLEERYGAVAVDIPIGLPETGTRACDRAARQILGGTRATVFWAPLRCTLAAADHAVAVRLATAAGGPAPSAQAWNLVPRIAAVDALLDPHGQARVVECHPEVAFRALDPAVADRKRTVRGQAQRWRALSAWLDVAGALAGAPDGPALHDFLDALACAWTAARVVTGQAVRLPRGPGQAERDARGLRMEIVS